jgi:hypothetical protein
MSSDDVFESWKRHRARVDVPPDFAAGVLARLPSRPERTEKARSSPWAGTWLRVAACVLAAAACLFRVAGVLGLFLPS